MVGDGRDRAPVHRGGRLPQRPHAADAARRAARDRPRHAGAADRCALPRWVGEPLLGRVIDGLGECRSTALGARPRPVALDHRRAAGCADAARASASASGSGVRALDTLVPCGRGQRLGIFAGSGVGKSSLLGMIARSTTADVNVIALVGERGREVREFIERDLGDALAHSVVVVATSDQPALVRIRAAFTATAIAEHFRDQGARRDADDGLGDALRDGPARGRPGDRRAAGDARLHAERVRAAAAKLLERAGTSPAARSPASTPCSSTATT
jgi:flagellum-specific ATP synthase